MIFGRQITLYMALFDALLAFVVAFHVIDVDPHQAIVAAAFVNAALVLIANNNTASAATLALRPRSRTERHASVVTHIEATTPAALPPQLRPTSKSRLSPVAKD